MQSNTNIFLAWRTIRILIFLRHKILLRFYTYRIGAHVFPIGFENDPSQWMRERDKHPKTHSKILCNCQKAKSRTLIIMTWAEVLRSEEFTTVVLKRTDIAVFYFFQIERLQKTQQDQNSSILDPNNHIITFTCFVGCSSLAQRSTVINFRRAGVLAFICVSNLIQTPCSPTPSLI